MPITSWEILNEELLSSRTFQILSLIPGTSRSGSTIMGGILLGTDRPIAAEFSFFMSIQLCWGGDVLVN